VKNKGYYTGVSYKEILNYYFPVDPEKNKFSLSGKQITSEVAMRDYGFENKRDGNTGKSSTSVSSNPRKSKYIIQTTINNTSVKGKEKIVTVAGTFNCYKLLMTTNMQTMGRNIDMVSAMFYDPEKGLIKTETLESKVKSGYTELVRVKK
jgi:hypothetical protein